MNIGAPRYPVLNGFMRARNRVDFIMGPLGSGKTVTCAQKVLAISSEQEAAPQRRRGEPRIRPTRHYAVRNTYKELATTTIKDFLEVWQDGVLGHMKYGGGMNPPTFMGKFQLPDNTLVMAEVIFLALDRPEDVKKLRGAQATTFWFNEAGEIYKAIIDMADGRIGRYPSKLQGVLPTYYGMFGDTNAPDEDSWYHEMAERKKPVGWKFHRQPGGVINSGELDKDGAIIWNPNPEAENLDNLPSGSGYYTNQVGSKKDAWIKIYLGNEYGFWVDGKPVHPEFSQMLHEIAEEDVTVLDAPLYCGFDFGRTPACAILQKQPGSGRKICIDEMTSENMPASLFGRELKLYLDEHYAGLPQFGWGDPAGEAQSQATDDTPIDVLNAAGIHCVPCDTNSPIVRRAAVAKPLTELCMDAKPRLLISKKCKMLCRGLSGGFQYKRKNVSGEQYSEEPDKNQYSHIVEALEYGCVGMGERVEALALPMARGGARGQTRARMLR